MLLRGLTRPILPHARRGRVRAHAWMDTVTRVLAVANQKGGVAKTTTVASLGAAMVEKGRRVLLVDLDPQGCLTFSLGQDPDKLAVSIHEVLLGDVEPCGGAGVDVGGNDADAGQHRPGRRRGDAADAGGPRIRAQARARPRVGWRLRRGDHRLPAVAGRAHPQRADRRRRRDRAAAVRDAGPPRCRPVPAHDHRRPADHQRRPERCSARCPRCTTRAPPTAATCCSTSPTATTCRCWRRRFRAPCGSPRRPRRARRCWPAARTRAHTPTGSWRAALLKHWKSGKALPTFAPEVEDLTQRDERAAALLEQRRAGDAGHHRRLRGRAAQRDEAFVDSRRRVVDADAVADRDDQPPGHHRRRADRDVGVGRADGVAVLHAAGGEHHHRVTGPPGDQITGAGCGGLRRRRLGQRQVGGRRAGLVDDHDRWLAGVGT